MRSRATSCAVGSAVGAPVDLAVHGEPGGTRRGGAQPLQGGRQRPGLSRSGGAQRAHEAAGLGEVADGGGAGPAGHGRAAVPVPLRQGALGGPQQQLDAGQALGEGVVDLAGQPLAFGEHPGGVFGGGQFGCGSR